MTNGADNADLVRRGYELFATRGVEGFLEFIDPEFELVTPPGLSLEPQTYVGHDGVRRYFDSFYDAMDEIRLEAKEFIAEGEVVIVPFRLVARGRETGIEAAMEAVQVWRLRDGRAIRCDLYPTAEAAREALD